MKPATNNKARTTKFKTINPKKTGPNKIQTEKGGTVTSHATRNDDAMRHARERINGQISDLKLLAS
jgi:hypothetical protein